MSTKMSVLGKTQLSLSITLTAARSCCDFVHGDNCLSYPNDSSDSVLSGGSTSTISSDKPNVSIRMVRK